MHDISWDFLNYPLFEINDTFPVCFYGFQVIIGKNYKLKILTMKKIMYVKHSLEILVTVKTDCKKSHPIGHNLCFVGGNLYAAQLKVYKAVAAPVASFMTMNYQWWKWKSKLRSGYGNDVLISVRGYIKLNRLRNVIPE